MTAIRDLMRLHIEALFTHDAAGDLLRVHEPNGAHAPRFFVGRTADDLVCRFRHDVDRDLRRELEAAVEKERLRDHALDSPLNASPFEEILARSAPIWRTETGPAFSFPAELPTSVGAIRITDGNAHILRPHLKLWLPDVQLGGPTFAIAVNGHAVAICCSVRRTGMAHEAGVETVAAHRGRGYAASVVSAWAQAVRDLGRTPLYSTSWQNAASRAVARKLGLIQFGNDLHIG